MSRAERGVLIILAGAAIVVIAIRTAWHYGWGRQPPVVIRAGSSSLPPIDLNRATWEELTLLPGIGEVRAKRIVAYRQRVGEIRDVAELRQVPGLSDSLVERIRSRVTVRRLRSGRAR